MSEEKDVHFTQKKVDESWKEKVDGEKTVEGAVGNEKEKKQKETEKKAAGATGKADNTKRQLPKMNFGIFLSSLGLQTLIHLGEIEHPETKRKEKNLDAARETIDLLLVLKDKTEGNRTPDEDKLLQVLITDLQMKYVSSAS